VNARAGAVDWEKRRNGEMGKWGEEELSSFSPFCLFTVAPFRDAFSTVYASEKVGQPTTQGNRIPRYKVDVFHAFARVISWAPRIHTDFPLYAGVGSELCLSPVDVRKV
jgi:hypothetical protein